MYLTNFQILSLENDLEQKFCTSGVFKNRRHKIIVDQTKSSQTLQILFVLTLKLQLLLRFIFRHRFTRFLPAF